MGCGGSKIYSAPTMAFLLMLKGKTNLQKYQNSKENIKHFDKAMASEVYGGSVLLPVGEKQKKRTKSNPLYDEITSMEKKTEGLDKPIAMDILKGGGYYIINNVRLDVTTNKFADIFILAETIEDKEVRQKLENSCTTALPSKSNLTSKATKGDKVDKTPSV